MNREIEKLRILDLIWELLEDKILDNEIKFYVESLFNIFTLHEIEHKLLRGSIFIIRNFTYNEQADTFTYRERKKFKFNKEEYLANRNILESKSKLK